MKQTRNSFKAKAAGGRDHRPAGHDLRRPYASWKEPRSYLEIPGESQGSSD